MKIVFTFLFVVLNFVFKFTVSINPGTKLYTYGIRVDASPILNKINYALYDKSRYPGIQIRIHTTGKCLDAGWATSPTGYSPFPTTCDAESDTQRWQLVRGVMNVAHKTALPNITGQMACLDCTSGREDCYLEVNGCTDNNMRQQFFIRVHDQQIDLPNGRVYFSIHSGLYKQRCMTRYDSSDKGGQTYYLDECSGWSEQSFYIQQDYTAEIGTIQDQIRPCASNYGVRKYSINGNESYVVV